MSEEHPEIMLGRRVGLSRPKTLLTGDTGLALAEILLLMAAILATLLSFWPISRLAGFLFIPYLCWVAFAAILNWNIWRLNA